MHLRHFANFSGSSYRIVTLALNIHGLAEKRELLALRQLLRVIGRSLVSLFLYFGTLTSAIELSRLEGRILLEVIDSVLHEVIISPDSGPDGSKRFNWCERRLYSILGVFHLAQGSGRAHLSSH